jgi:hypothetical protein
MGMERRTYPSLLAFGPRHLCGCIDCSGQGLDAALGQSLFIVENNEEVEIFMVLRLKLAEGEATSSNSLVEEPLPFPNVSNGGNFSINLIVDS